ncbi:t-SNARE [Cucurbitaria berberidis CBS 394.84]|uniref:t-SNARE n=1 Tax=Cucurbitaria berberidis CBS 394.84 TaxID=1168544 RepID=A0A9P4GQB6_9PLEO|nr:t-SNARE [Cucurbitaria berberidis CBS 394.84]KAF1849384.1 t-SNARE [Cucurbitaria berberidis CBS 394.84]
MSQNYQQYSGNPYGQAEAGYGQSQSNPYGGTGYGQSNPYGGGQYDEQLNPPAQLQHGDSNYSQPSQYSQTAPPTQPSTNQQNVAHATQPGQYGQQQPGAKPLTQQDFLSRIDGTKQRIGQLTSDIQAISNIHQRMLSSPDNRSSAELESIVSQTQIRNTQIKDEIKFLEKDAAREPNNTFKRTQVEALKRTFKSQLEDFQREEADYSKRYREAIGRQYRIVNPEATEAEVQEAANADWGEEGIFTQALKSNRSGQASSVLGAVRARHNDIQRIEKTMSELALLFTQLNEQVVYQEAQVTQVENQTVQVNDDSKHANTQLDQGIKSARRARKLKWWTLFVVVLILVIVGLALGLWFGVGGGKPKKQ